MAVFCLQIAQGSCFSDCIPECEAALDVLASGLSILVMQSGGRGKDALTIGRLFRTVCTGSNFDFICAAMDPQHAKSMKYEVSVTCPS